MNSENKAKLNNMLKNWPAGTVMTHRVLAQHGVYQQLVDRYVKSGWLEAVDRGVFKRAGDQVNWLSGLMHLQDGLSSSFHVAAKSALELAGVQHFLHPNAAEVLWLFGHPGDSLPAWFVGGDVRQKWGRDIKALTPKLFRDNTIGLKHYEIKTFNGMSAQIVVSTLERAVLELLYLVPRQQTLEEAKYLIEGLMSLRPELLQELLQSCESIKVKRLFLFLADFCNLPCYQYLDHELIDLGHGKRMLKSGGGHYIEKYQLSIPKSFYYTFLDEFHNDE